MAQYRLNAYDADVFIPEFKGLLQYGDPYNNDLRFSPDCLNVETPGGVLQPAPKLEGVRMKAITSESPTYEYEDMTAKAGTIMHLHTNPSGPSLVNYAGDNLHTATTSTELDYYFVFANSKMYMFVVQGDLKQKSFYGAYPQQGTWPVYDWSWCVYEHDYGSGGQFPSGIVNVLIMSHPTKGVYYFIGNSLNDITSDVPSKFSHIARYADRIWGVGTGENKDSIYYSRPYSYDDWSQDNDDPAMGGGEIREPTFDDDKLVALVPFGDSLIAFSEKRAWKITGSDPTNFMIQEQYGNGCKYPETICVMDNRIIMLGNGGLVSYDGYQVQPFLQDCTHDLFRRVFEYKPKPKATRIGDKYVLAMSNELVSPNPVTTINEVSSTADPDVTYPFKKEGYSLLVYDSRDGDIVRMDTPQVMSFCHDDPIMFTTNTEVIDDVEYRYNEIVPLKFDSWYQHRITGNATKWASPWITLGRQDIKKGGFELYFTPEIEPYKQTGHQLWRSDYEDYESAIQETDVPGSVTFKFSVQTEKKTKTKTYTVQPLTAEEIAAGKQYKMKRLHFGGSGRRFRLIIETDAGGTIPWRLIGGIHIIAETDKD